MLGGMGGSGAALGGDAGAGAALDAGGGAGGIGGMFAGMDFMGMFKSLFSDPESAKSIGDAIKALGGVAASIQKIPPQTRQLMQGAIQQQMQQQQDRLNPYGGDMMQFITPEMARGVLDEFGIPYGRMRL